MNPVEAETIARLRDVGMDFTPYIVPDSYIPFLEWSGPSYCPPAETEEEGEE